MEKDYVVEYRQKKDSPFLAKVFFTVMALYLIMIVVAIHHSVNH